MAISRQRLEFATAGFLAEMRKQFAKAHPDRECPIKALGDYSPSDRSALMAGVEKAILFADQGSDATFTAWVKRREEQMSEVA